jgi:nucleotide-binding universal stress UspA family protein
MSTKIKGQFSKILVGIDGSETSMKAADYAIEMARKDGAQLIALTVNPLTLSSYGLATPQDESQHLKEEKEESKHWLDNVSRNAKQKNVQVKTEVVYGQMSIEGAIVEYAESEGVDLIVIGTKGSSGLKNKLLGSVASGVVSSATCPAMVVK